MKLQLQGIVINFCNLYKDSHRCEEDVVLRCTLCLLVCVFPLVNSCFVYRCVLCSDDDEENNHLYNILQAVDSLMCLCFCLHQTRNQR